MMELVVDTNILAAAIVRAGTTRSLVFRADIVLHAPDYSEEELKRNKGTFLEKSGLEECEYAEVVKAVISNIRQAPLQEYAHLQRQAEDASPDRKDWPFFALAMHLKCGIWSNEKRLKKQEEVQVYGTADLCRLFVP